MSDKPPEYPKLCDLCQGTIESVEDLDWHGYGNCVEIPEGLWEDLEKDANER